MIKTPISADTLKLVQARRSLEAEKAADKARAREAKKKATDIPVGAAKVGLEVIEPEVVKNKRYIAHQIDTPADLLLAHRPDLKLYRLRRSFNLQDTLISMISISPKNDPPTRLRYTTTSSQLTAAEKIRLLLVPSLSGFAFPKSVLDASLRHLRTSSLKIRRIST